MRVYSCMSMDKKILFELRSDTFNTIFKLYDQTEESLLEDVKNLKEWMKTQPHLPEILDEKTIENFLILNKWSIERAKESIDSYYTMRTLVPDMYDNINPKLPNMTQLLDIIYWVPLPKLTKENYRASIFKMRNKNMIDLMEPHNVLGHMINVQEVRLKEDVMFGDVAIFDTDGLNFNYIKKLTPTILAKTFAIYERVFSIPLKAIYVINSSPFINTILSILKTLMKPKLFERIHVCEDVSILNKAFPMDMLPKDYGGQEKSLEELQDLLKQKFYFYQERFDQLDRMKVTENLRPEKLKNDEFLGFHGNFKKLNVD